MRTSDPARVPVVRVSRVGLVGSLGLDAATCCAAARAGLSRARPFDGYTVVDSEGEDVGVSAHCLPLGTDGFEGDARLLQLMVMAMRDLGAGCSPDGWSGTRSYLALPDPARWGAADSAGQDASRVAELRAAVPDRSASLWRQLSAALDPLGLPPLHAVHAIGQTGFHRAVAQAARDLRAGEVRRCLVGAVDSLLDADGLAELEEAGRLKTPSDPAGLQPGEAAGFVLLESDGDDSGASAGALAVVRALAFSREEHTRFADGAPTGRGIAAALLDAARHVPDKSELPWWIVSDHNGEPYRAMDWGNALVHLEAGHRIRLTESTLFPASALGDTGAAGGVVALSMAALAFTRGYAPSRVAALVSCGDGGERSALVCQAP